MLTRVRQAIKDRFRISNKPTKKDERPPSSINPTRYARVYGDSQHYLFSFDGKRGKSGITPRLLEFPMAPINSPLEYAEQEFYEQYEVEQLGFMTQVMNDMGVIRPMQQALTNDLTNPIFQGFSLDRWDPVGTMLMDDGTGRRWSMHEPDVYAACEPILRLASRLMTHCQNNDYWDALLAGERRPISPERLPLATTRRGTNSNALLTVDQLNLQSFHRRDPQQRLRQPVNWNQAVPYLELEIRGTDDDKHTTAFSAQTGLTTSSYWKPGDPELSDITLRLNPRLLFPLIGLSLVENERLAQQFYVAVTLCHEYAHAISYWLDKPKLRVPNEDPLKRTKEEPYYEDEIVNEIGFGGEKALFGGSIPEFPQGDPREEPPHPDPKFRKGHPKYFCATETFPAWREIRDGSGRFNGAPFLLAPPVPLETALYPFPLRFIQDIQQDKFWETQVNKHSGDALQIYPKVFGSFDRGKAGDEDYFDKRYGFVKWQLYNDWVHAGRPSRHRFVRRQGLKDYDIIKATETLTMRDHLQERAKEHAERERDLRVMATVESEREVEEYRKEFMKNHEEWDKKRQKEWDEKQAAAGADPKKKRKRGVWGRWLVRKSARGAKVEDWVWEEEDGDVCAKRRKIEVEGGMDIE